MIVDDDTNLGAEVAKAIVADDHQPQSATPRTDDIWSKAERLERELAALRAPLLDVESRVFGAATLTGMMEAVPADYARRQAAQLREAQDTLAVTHGMLLAARHHKGLAEQQRDGEMMAHQVTMQQRDEAVLSEREACAIMCDAKVDVNWRVTQVVNLGQNYESMAAAIRARSEGGK